MGIKNLLPFVSQASRKGKISEFNGKTVAVDVSCLLHRSFSACAADVAQGKRSDKYICFIRRYIDLLLHEGCRVIMVFDGQSLPAKRSTNEQRSENRRYNLKLGRMSLENGDQAQAYRYFIMSAGITPDIVEHTIEEFRALENVDIVVAPYEADAQLAYLMKSGLADAVVTEDSDLIPFGCDTIIFKLNLNSECVIYERNLLSKCVNRGLSRNFDFNKFRRMCILSGCDYFPGIHKVGLTKAAEVFAKSNFSTDFGQIAKFLKKIPLYLDLKKVKVDDKIIRAFIEAEYTFLHQIVFDPITRTQIPLNDYPTVVPPDVKPFLNKIEPFWFAGKVLSAEDAFRRAIGNHNLKGVHKFKMDNPPAWSIYHPDRIKALKERESSVELMDSGYSSNNSQHPSNSGYEVVPQSPDENGCEVVPPSPDDPFRDSSLPEEIEILLKQAPKVPAKILTNIPLKLPPRVPLKMLCSNHSTRFQRTTVTVSSTPSSPAEMFVKKPIHYGRLSSR